MGCSLSRIENEDVVVRCKERKQHMRAAVAARNAFAAAHAAYTAALKDTGSALSGFAQGEAPLPITDPTISDPIISASPSAATSTLLTSSAAVAAVTQAGSTSAVIPPPMEPLPPPPPLPFSPSPVPIQRSVSMPEMPKKVVSKLARDPSTEVIREEDDDVGVELEPPKTPPSLPPQQRPAHPQTPPPPAPTATPWDYFFDTEEHMPGPTLAEPEEDEILSAEVEHNDASVKDDDSVPVTPVKVDEPPTPLPPPPPEEEEEETPVKKTNKGKAVQHHHAASASALEFERSKVVAAAAAVPGISLVQVLNDLDEHFLNASKAAHEVSKMLEANRMHYHSNFVDNKGYIDSTRVMKVITWNKPSNDTPNSDDKKDDFSNDESETLATVLDKLLAWEKKLCDEIKEVERMKIVYQRKAAILSKQRKHGSNSETLERTKAAVSHLQTRYIVDMQSLDTTVSEIQLLRDDQLYPRLVKLVDGMAKMWEIMHSHHDNQRKIALYLKGLDISSCAKETSEHHHAQTRQLCQVVKIWQMQFEKLVGEQKAYVDALNSWLKLNLIPIETSLKEKPSPPQGVLRPPIQGFLVTWHDYLEKLPSNLAKDSISSFSAIVETIVLVQDQELKQKEICDNSQREYMRKARAFEEWWSKYSLKHTTFEVSDPQNSETKDPVTEKKFAVETLKKKLDEDVEEYQKLCKQVREKSITCLKTHLPELFYAMSAFALASCEMYKKMLSISQTQNPDVD